MRLIKGGVIFLTSTRHRKWIVEAAKQIEGIQPIPGVQFATLTFYPSTRRRSDLTNKAESIMDLLVDAGILEDDNWFVVPKVTLLFGGIDKDNPRVEIELRESEPQD